MILGAHTIAAQQPSQPPGQTTEARLRAQREELDRMRRERDELQQRMSQLQGTVHGLSEEVSNISQQADATARLVHSLDAQIGGISAELAQTTGSLVRAEDELAIKRAVLHRRLVDIYKRGPLYTAEALLSADNFGDLLARYKYLYQLARRDRTLVERVELLAGRIAEQRQSLVQLGAAYERSRQDKTAEERRLRALEQQRSRSLTEAQRNATDVEARLSELRRDEARVTTAIEGFEGARKSAEASASAPTPSPADAGTRPTVAALSTSSIRASDFGTLEWPVVGSVLYRYGREVKANNTTTRWNGVGISAPAGTPVHAVAAGEVALVEGVGTYGLTIILQHGGGDYSVYGSLASASVEKGARVTKGQVIGTVGTTGPDLPPHLHFEMRPKGRAMDPLAWLRK